MAALEQFIKAVVAAPQKPQAVYMRGMQLGRSMSELKLKTQQELRAMLSPLRQADPLTPSPDAFKTVIQWGDDPEEVAPFGALFAMVDGLKDELSGNAQLRVNAAYFLQAVLPIFFIKVGNISRYIDKLMELNQAAPGFVVKQCQTLDYGRTVQSNIGTGIAGDGAYDGGRGFVVGQGKRDQEWSLILTYNPDAAEEGNVPAKVWSAARDAINAEYRTLDI
jgi:hypothetical protein